MSRADWIAYVTEDVGEDCGPIGLTQRIRLLPFVLCDSFKL
jgi:hypothetical protein